ncbi:MAG: hypothetical protein OCC49_10540 [Fibrobacterales bacterium]
MKYLKNFLISTCALMAISAGSVFAGNCEGTIKEVYYANGKLSFQTTCHDKDIGITETGEERNTILSIILTAKAAQNTMKIYWTDGNVNYSHWDTFGGLHSKL